MCFTEDPKLEKQDSFVEKLVTQVIKNVQVKISNIHVRYEDDVSISLKMHPEIQMQDKQPGFGQANLS